MTFRKGWWKDYRSIHLPAPAIRLCKRNWITQTGFVWSHSMSMWGVRAVARPMPLDAPVMTAT
ncbi:hypothetical protein CAP37_07665 [Hydrogenophaga sp. IBVHS1]|nr:hypothetical protein CAP37_07665 [Hydrogenophaga sp. IBVHS1]